MEVPFASTTKTATLSREYQNGRVGNNGANKRSVSDVMVGLILKRNFSLTLRFSHVLTFALVDSTYLSLCMHFRMAKKLTNLRYPF